MEQAQQAREGFNALKLNGVLKPASAVAAPTRRRWRSVRRN
ncbi:ribonuclease HI [Rothia aeria]|uniref:Ribonuclease HI n=1 Tax=Rothia aeria TaxID=172042 RepID=A0A2Z5QVK8_9MICC|nr:ribonuclease HI [Rothia aeria]